MMKTIAIVSSKGGTGKTTVTLNLAVALAEMGQPTLVADVDPQGAIGLSLARQELEWAGLTEVMLGQANLDEVLVQTKLPGLSILPRGRMNPIDSYLFEREIYSSNLLAKALGSMDDLFAYGVVDTPPGLGMATRAALQACRYVIVLIQAEPLALRSLGQVLHVVEEIKRERQGGLDLLGILPTMVDLSKEASMDVMAQLWNGFSGLMETFIPRADVFQTASGLGLPISFMGGPVQPEARRFEMLAREIKEIIASLGETTGEGYERKQRAII